MLKELQEMSTTPMLICFLKNIPSTPSSIYMLTKLSNISSDFRSVHAAGMILTMDVFLKLMYNTTASRMRISVKQMRRKDSRLLNMLTHGSTDDAFISSCISLQPAVKIQLNVNIMKMYLQT